MKLSADSNIQNLEKIFTTFTQVSTALDESYSELEKQVVCLNKELAAARSSRLKDLKIKEQLAAKLSTLMESLPGGVLVTNKDDIITQENPAAVEILGNSVIGQTWTLVLESSTPLHKDNLQAFTLSNGKHISVSTREFGKQQDKIVLVTDITENLNLQQQLNQDIKLKDMGEMTGRLAHQIRTPLSTAILYLSQLRNSKNNPDSVSSCTNKIQERLQQVEKLINSMLCYIREGANPRQNCSLGVILTDVVRDYSPLTQELGGDISLQFLTANQLISCNQMEIRNALSNLIDNALCATETTPHIVIELARENNSFIIRIIDNGPGIDPVVIDRIFDPFFSTRTDGTGLGLAIVMSIIKGHGGDISGYNNSSQGACFEIRLPVNPNSTTSTECLWQGKTQIEETISLKESNQ